MVQPCPFEILGIKDFDAPSSAIESAFRKRSLDCHPDKKPGDPTAKAQFEATIEVLLDPVRRAAAQSSASTARRSCKGPFTRFAQCRAAAQRAGAKSSGKPPRPAETPSQPTQAEQAPGCGPEKPRQSQGADPEKVAAGIFFRHLEREREKKEGPREYILPRPRFGKSAEEPPPVRIGLETRHRPRHSGVQDGAGVFAKVKKLSEMAQPSPPLWVGGDVPRTHNVHSQKAGSTEQVKEHSVEPENVKRCEERSNEDGEVKAEKQVKRSRCDKGAARGPCPPLPLLLPTTDRAALVTAIGDVTGAHKSDARVLARVVEILREKGGQAPLAVLTRNPKRLQTILSRHAQLLEVYLPGKYLAGTTLQVHVRLRGAELQRAVECFQRTVQAKAKAGKLYGLAKAEKCAKYAHVVRRHKATVKSRRPCKRLSGVVDLDSSEGSCCEAVQKQTPARRHKPAELLPKQIRIPIYMEQSEPDSSAGSFKAAHSQEGCDQSANKLHEQTSMSCDACEADHSEADRLLHRAYAHAVGRWKASSPSGPSSGRRYFLLLPAALKRMDVFREFNSQPQVLYEYVPSQGEGRCVVAWSPSCPEVNALLWTVLPLPPDDPSSLQEAPATPPLQTEEDEEDEKELLDSPEELIDSLIRDAAAEAGVPLG
ncbi:unnamed protein product [Durusdinium trenchii]|uniref:J domain-containing protein n=1 Tax=Durusdinium trenchii TaxID=1381693 RepID=A0ABP0KFR0_9DINO